jgi:hypothetical protein
MRVLHVCNPAGVGSVIAKFMDRLFGTESLVIQRRIFDPYGLTTYGELWDCGAKMFVLKCLWLARKYDIVHVHSFDKIVPFLKLLYPGKIVVLHYHGTDIRGKWKQRQKYWSKADALLYSVKDVEDKDTPKNAVHLPNPVDTDMFQPGSKEKLNQALTISHYADDLAKEIAQLYGLKLTVLTQKIPHIEMPKLLSQHEYYIEIKRDKEGRILGRENSVSVTALEALACGCKVIKGWDKQILEKLPEQHLPEKVVTKLFKIYKDIMGEDYEN